MPEVLVVEDSRFFASVLRSGIEDRLGFRMCLATSRAEAKRLLAADSGRFFAALLDVNLPDSHDGEIVDDVAALGIPSIVFTGTFDDEMREFVLSKNVVDYVTKSTPTNMDHVMSLLRRLSVNTNTRVMVVDDSRVSRLHLRALLGIHRFNLIEANSGSDALKLLAANPDVRLVLTDFHMDGMNGCELIERMRRTHPRDRLVIIGVSAYGNNVLSARFMKSGASDFVSKPYVPEELFCRIYQNLELIEQIDSLTKMGVSLASSRQEMERLTSADLLKNPAYFDPLTGLPTRRLALDRLGTALATCRRDGRKLAVIHCDLDLFKRINDSLGHNAGDTILQEVTARLTDCVRDGDTVARIGPDEFMLVLPEHSGLDEIVALAERIIATVRAPMMVGKREIYVTASAGIALYPEDGADADTLIKNAETAMYRAKEAGRNSFQLYAPIMNARSSELLSMETELRHALGRKQFRLVYQGKVDLASGGLSGVEALIRWQHPELGMVSPADFIPIAENIGLIAEIGAWVLNQACMQAADWLGKGLPPLTVSINVSARQFKDHDVTGLVAAALKASGLPPQLLELELTETLLVQQIEETSAILHKLRSLGVRVSVDDFGTGYSSLSYLSRIPLDALKIDRSFVRNLGQSDEDAEIVSTIINLAHSLKLKAIAEGVETLEQADFLSQRGCDEIQGFLVARPMSADDLVSLMDRRLLERE